MRYFKKYVLYLLPLLILLILLLKNKVNITNSSAIIKQKRLTKIRQKYKLENSFQYNLLKIYLGEQINNIDYWFVIALVETGRFKSDLYRKYKNWWGMKRVKRRPTTQIGETQNGYGIYSNDIDAVRDIVMYAKYFQIKNEYQNVVEFVKDLKIKKYFEAPLEKYLDAIIPYYEETK